MCKSDIYRRLLKLTAEETEISSERITGMYTDMESTDARYILATLLYEQGFYPSQIAPLINRKPRGVRALLARGLTSKMVGIMLARIRQKAGNDS